jgi:hypothetical protein
MPFLPFCFIETQPQVLALAVILWRHLIQVYGMVSPKVMQVT